MASGAAAAGDLNLQSVHLGATGSRSSASTISVFDPAASWSAKWLLLGASERPPRAFSPDSANAEKQVPGCYALSVTDTIADDLPEED